MFIILLNLELVSCGFSCKFSNFFYFLLIGEVPFIEIDSDDSKDSNDEDNDEDYRPSSETSIQLEQPKIMASQFSQDKFKNRKSPIDLLQQRKITSMSHPQVS